MAQNDAEVLSEQAASGLLRGSSWARDILIRRCGDAYFPTASENDAQERRKPELSRLHAPNQVSCSHPFLESTATTSTNKVSTT